MSTHSPILSPTTGLILLSALSAIWVWIGIWLGKKAKDLEGYMLAGRNVGIAFGMATVMATWITSNTTMLAPQFALQLGIWGMVAYSTASFGLLLFAPLARRIRSLMPHGFTSGDFVRLRYGRNTWMLFLVISIIYGFTWLISMGMAGGILMNAITGIPYTVGMSVILFVCVAYTVYGGLYAVIATDFSQSIIIMIGIVVVGAAVLYQVDTSVIYADLRSNQPMLASALLPAAIMALFNNLLFSVGEVFHSNVWWSRAFAIREDVGRRSYYLASLFWLPIPIAAGFIALAGNSLGLNITSPDMAGPFIAAHVLGQFGAIIVFIVFFCSLASSIDSLLAATSDLIVEDVFGKLFEVKATEQSMRRLSAWVICGLGLLAWLVCLPRIGTLATVLFFAGPLVGSTIWPIATGLLWKKANANGAFWGMLLGSLSGLAAYFTLGWYTASVVGAAVSMAVVVVATKLSHFSFSWENLNESESGAH